MPLEYTRAVVDAIHSGEAAATAKRRATAPLQTVPDAIASLCTVASCGTRLCKSHAILTQSPPPRLPPSRRPGKGAVPHAARVQPASAHRVPGCADRAAAAQQLLGGWRGVRARAAPAGAALCGQLRALPCEQRVVLVGLQPSTAALESCVLCMCSMLHMVWHDAPHHTCVPTNCPDIQDGGGYVKPEAARSIAAAGPTL